MDQFARSCWVPVRPSLGLPFFLVSWSPLHVAPCPLPCLSLSIYIMQRLTRFEITNFKVREHAQFLQFHWCGMLFHVISFSQVTHWHTLSIRHCRSTFSWRSDLSLLRVRRGFVFCPYPCHQAIFSAIQHSNISFLFTIYSCTAASYYFTIEFIKSMAK